jgi:hypothetical protein
LNKEKASVDERLLKKILKGSVLRIRILDPVLFYPGIRDGAMVGSGIRDKQTKFINSLYTKIGRIRDPVLFYPPDPGWSNGRIRIRDPG